MEYHIQQPPSPVSTASSASSTSSPSRDASLRIPSDEELRREGIEKVIQRLRFAENENKKLLVERKGLMKDVNRKLQVHLLEVRGVREVNQKLMQDKELLLKEKEELAGICCFLDDDREKAKKVAREWQMFGRYATGVLQKELSACHSKIRELETRQNALMQENRNLKELCLMLDQEQAGSRNSVDSQNSLPCPPGGLLTAPGTRDSGDGSSNESTTSNCSPDHRHTTAPLLKDIIYSSDPAHGPQYIRYLEHKIRQLEEEAKGRVERVSVPPTSSSSLPPAPPRQGFSSPGKLERKFFSSSVLPITSQSSDNRLVGSNSDEPSAVDRGLLFNFPNPQEPEAIVSAMKVLELHDQLNDGPIRTDRPDPSNAHVLDEKQKAMVREMCNVVWRKLGDQGRPRLFNGKPPAQRTASISNL